MKVFTFLSFIFTSTFCFSQNIFPISGNVGIGIANGDPYSELIYLQTGDKSLNFYTNSVHRAMIDSNGGSTDPSKN